MIDWFLNFVGKISQKIHTIEKLEQEIKQLKKESKDMLLYP